MFLSRKCSIYIKDTDTTIETKTGKSLYEVLKENGLMKKTMCDGSGLCGQCKVKVDGNSLPKITRHEKQELSEISLDSGFRLACQFNLKGDVVVDIEAPKKWAKEDPDILEVVEKADDLRKQHNMNTRPDIDKAFEEAKTIKPVEQPKEPEINQDDEDEIIIDEAVIEETVQEILANEKGNEPEEVEEIVDEEASIDVCEPDDDDSYSTDGLLLIQKNGYIDFYVYSAGIGNISSNGQVKSEVGISDVIDNGFLDRFIEDNIKQPDLDRIIVILDKKEFEGTSVFDRVSYTCFTIPSGKKCEVLQPESNFNDILRFMRLINQSGGKKLIIPVDMIEKVYLYNAGSIIDLCAMDSDVGLGKLSIPLNGKNPIIDITDDLKDVVVKDNFHTPDSISFALLFKIAALLHRNGLVDNELNLKDRSELLNEVPLDILVKLSKNGNQNVFNLFRKQGAELFIDENSLSLLNDMRIFLKTVIQFTERAYGHVDKIVFYTVSQCDTLVDDMLDLNMIPSAFKNRIQTFYGDPTVFGVQFFNEGSVRNFLKNRIDFKEKIVLFNSEEFNEMYAENSKPEED